MATIALTNLITNGSFEVNVNGWSGFLTNNQNAQSTLAPLRVTPPLAPRHNEYGIAAAQMGTKTQGVVYMNPAANLGAIVGHKYYIRSQIRLRGTTPGVVSVGTIVNALDPVTGANIIPIRGIVAQVPLETGLQTTNSTDWVLIDAIWTADTALFNPRWIWQTTANSGNNELYGQLDNVVIVDLTATFGAGNEPPLFAIREGVISYSQSGYWDGTADIEMPIPPVIASDAISPGLKGRPYSSQIVLQEGTGTSPFSYSLSGLPVGSGLSIDSNGVISGILNLDEGQYAVTVQLVDAIGYTTSKQFTLDIGEPPLIHDDYIPSASYLQPYTFTPTVTGSDGDLTTTLTVTSGTLPVGLTISGATISGTPIVDGQTCQITVTAYNIYDPEGVSKVFTLAV